MRPNDPHLPLVQYGLVNEIHPGNYIFFDLMQYHLGSCTLDDCAGRVLTTVVCRPPAHVVVDSVFVQSTRAGH
jgi:D-serine deaminase-like pyridoxal phosphate-dependent protein